MNDVEMNLEIGTDIEIDATIDVSDVVIGEGMQPPVAYMLPDPYQGSYTVTPSFAEQVLETRDKSMADDVTVEEIPVHRVSNAAGGITLTIGG